MAFEMASRGGGMGFNVFELQKGAMMRMVALQTKDEPKKMDVHQVWKVLIYDKVCREIIAPLLNIGSLRTNGVTLNLLLDAARDPVPDVTAVYFVAPTQENINRILQDFQGGLYEKVHVNFCSSIDQQLLRYFAEGVAKAGAVQKVTSVRFLFLIKLIRFQCLQIQII